MPTFCALVPFKRSRLVYIYPSLQVYLDDALGERVWVDRSDCRGFVDNIATAFQTNLPKGGLATIDIKTDQPSGSGIEARLFLLKKVDWETSYRIHFNRFERREKADLFFYAEL